MYSGMLSLSPVYIYIKYASHFGISMRIVFPSHRCTKDGANLFALTTTSVTAGLMDAGVNYLTAHSTV